MIKALNPNYKVPGHKYFSKTAIPGLYNNVKHGVQVLLSGAEHYSLTTPDSSKVLWLSVNMTPYMSLTVHIITPEWKPES